MLQAVHIKQSEHDSEASLSFSKSNTNIKPVYPPISSQNLPFFTSLMVPLDHYFPIIIPVTLFIKTG